MLAADLHEGMYGQMMFACCCISCVAVLPIRVMCPSNYYNHYWQTDCRVIAGHCVFLLCRGSRTACKRQTTPITLICMYMLHTARHTRDCLQPVLQTNKAAAQQLTDTDVRPLAARQRKFGWSQLYFN